MISCLSNRFNVEFMKIAVLGAGYAGLACAWHLLHSPFRPRGVEVAVFDKQGIGGGASGIAAGLLHPYVGQHAKLNWRGQEGMMATQGLLRRAAEALGKPVSSATGLLRVALTGEQEKNYRRCALDNNDVLWWSAEECSKAVPSLSNHLGGIFIKNAQTVLSKEYLNGLWKSCQLQRADLLQTPIEKLAQLRHFDRVIVAAGSGTLDIEELIDLPVSLVKGQLLELQWPPHIPPLPFSVNSQAYVVMGPDNLTCLAGATYERGFENVDTDIEWAKQEILPKLSFLPHLQYTPILGCRSQVRVSAKNHLPFTKQINSRVWVISGMGSKGLLYHGLFAKELASKVLQS
jgi:glycine/D-amino acid oxidase-like deaminating enzyme